ncbi:MAG: hypothetical protein ABI186_00460 [Candidatus Elarobacter sp.]
MASDTPPKSDAFTKPANGTTAGSYFVDGRYNIGGWSTYPSADATYTTQRPPAANDLKR